MQNPLDRHQKDSCFGCHQRRPMLRTAKALSPPSVLIWGLVLAVVLSLLGPAQGQTDPNNPASYHEIRPDRNAPSSSSASPSALSDQLSRHLWESRIAPPDPNEDIETRQSIEELIRKIRSVKFDDATPDPTFKPPSPKPAAPKTDPNGSTETAVETPEESTDSDVTVPMPTAPAETALPAITLQRLEELLEDPNEVENPLEVAELLFLSGRPVEAGVFYKRALSLMPPDTTGANNDRAWVLFQLGNCLRETNVAKAKESYMKLISDYPASPWTELAKSYGRLITWYQSANPKQLISKEESS